MNTWKDWISLILLAALTGASAAMCAVNPESLRAWVDFVLGCAISQA